MEIHPRYVPFPYIVLRIHIHLSPQPFAKGKMPSPGTTHPRARPEHSEGSAAHGASRTAPGSRSAGQGAQRPSPHPNTATDRAWGGRRGKEQMRPSRQGTPPAHSIPTVISAGDFPACAGLLNLLFVAQVSPSLASRGWMSPLLPGTRHQQPSPEQPSLWPLEAELSPGGHHHKGSAG